MLQGERLLRALAELPAGPKTGTAYRLIHVKYAQTPLSAAGAIRTGGRYNLADVFEALYLADSPVTALQEVQAIIAVGSSLIPVKGPPRILLSVDYTLQSVLDLTDAEVHRALGTSFQELTGAWIPYALQETPAPTQHLGHTAWQAGIEALVVPSAKDLTALNLVVFPTQLRPGSRLRVDDDSGTIREKLPREAAQDRGSLARASSAVARAKR